jgi:hypothetical protein
MALTPSTVTTTAGLIQGTGLTVSTEMLATFVTSNTVPIITSLNSVKTAPNVANCIAALTTTLNALPDFINNSSPYTHTITVQAQGMLPAQTKMGIKDFVSLLNTAAGFCISSANYTAALTELTGKTFSDFGIGVKNLTGVSTGGVTSIVPSAPEGYPALILRAKQQGFDSLGPVLPGQDPYKSGITLLTNILKSTAQGLRNFGSLYDFSDLLKLGQPQNLISSLQKQGLTSKNGINDQITAAGYSTLNLSIVPTNILTSILGTVTGSELQKVITQTNATLVKTPDTLADLLYLDYFMPATTIKALGFRESDLNAINQLGNKLLNLGSQTTNTGFAQLLESVEITNTSYVDQTKQLIPTGAVDNIKLNLGTGSGPFKNPLLVDCVGTVAGYPHTDTYTSIISATKSASSNPYGADVIMRLDDVTAAITAATDPGTDPAVASALLALDTAISNFNNYWPTNSSLAKLFNDANAGLAKSRTQLSTEVSNLIDAGTALYTGVVNLGTDSNDLMSFGTSLHDYGVDPDGLGYNKILAPMATPDIYGDSIKLSLAEGRNLARISKLGKNTPAIANKQKTTADAVAAQIDTLTKTYQAANKVFVDANTAFINNTQTSKNAQLLQQVEIARQLKDKAAQTLAEAKRLSGNTPFA